MGPYNTSKPLYTASMNLHSTIVILRGATRYLHLSRRLALQIAETSPQKSSVDPHALLRAANTIDELSTSLPTSKSSTKDRLSTAGDPTISIVTYNANSRQHHSPTNHPTIATSSK